MLEEKNDLDLSLMHVRELVRSLPELTDTVSAWLKTYQAVNALEQKVGEQHTVVQVYRSALQKDSNMLLKDPGDNSFNRLKRTNSLLSSVPHDKSILSSWKQFRDKLASTKLEISKWMEMQNDLLSALSQFCDAVRSRVLELKTQESSESLTDTEPATLELRTRFREIVRGIHMISRQSQAKLLSTSSVICTVRSGFVSFDNLGAELNNTLTQYENAIVAETSEITNKSELSSARGNLSKEMVLQDLRKCKNNIDALTSKLVATKNQSMINGDHSISSSNFRELSTSEYSVECSDGAGFIINSNGNKVLNNSLVNMQPNSQHCWVCEKPSSSAFMDYSFVQSYKLHGFRVQGGNVWHAEEASVSVDCVEPSLVEKLPCGLSLDTTNGEDVELTINSLGDVLDWTALLKKNPPEKFLKRPPVRFLFDLFKYVSLPSRTKLVWPVSIQNTTWETIADSKQLKLEFMDEV